MDLRRQFNSSSVKTASRPDFITVLCSAKYEKCCVYKLEVYSQKLCTIDNGAVIIYACAEVESPAAYRNMQTALKVIYITNSHNFISYF